MASNIIMGIEIALVIIINIACVIN